MKAFLLLMFGGLISVAAAQSGPNLLANGDFEAGPWGAEADARASQVDLLVSHGGAQSGRIDARPDAERYVYGAAATVDPAHSYLLTAWIRCRGLEAPDAVHLRVLQWDAQKPLGWVWNLSIGEGVKELIVSGGTRNWTRYAAVLRGLDPATTRLVPFLAIGPGRGTAWVDDVQIRLLEGEQVPTELSEPYEEPGGDDVGVEVETGPAPAEPKPIDLQSLAFEPRIARGQNELQNGEFEDPVPADWAGAVALDREIRHGQEASLALRPGDGMLATMPRVSATSDYCLSAWVRTEEVPRDGLRLRLWPGWWNEATMSEELIITGGSQDWTRYEIEMTNLPAELQGKTWWLRYSLEGGPDGKARAWLDDVTIEPLSDCVRVSSAGPGNLFFEGEIAELQYHLHHARGGRPRTVRWTTTDMWGHVSGHGSAQLLPDPNGAAQVAVPLSGPGYYRFAFVLEDAEGRPLQGTEVSAGLLPAPPADARELRPESVFACWGVPADLAPLLGIKWTRWMERSTHFSPVEGQTLQFDWTLKQYYGDYQPRRTPLAHRQAGVNTYLCFHQFADWLTRAPDGSTAPVPRDWDRFADWVAFVYSQVADVVPVVEVWNEPVIPWGWQGTPEDVVTLHRVVYQTLKQINPDVKVIGPCDTIEHLETFGRLGGMQWVDAVSIHPYRNGSPEATDFVGELRRAKAIAARYGKPSELWVTEMGWTTAPGRFTEREQADWIVRAYVQALSEGVANLNVHIFGDWNNASVSEKYFGITRTDHTPKPAAIAYATMTRNLEGARYAGRLDWLGRAAYGYVFLRDGEPLLVLWNAGADGVPAELPVGAATVRVESLDGRVEELACEEGRMRLKLGQSPVFVTGVAAALYPPGASELLEAPAAPVAVAAGDEVALTLQVANSTDRTLAAQLELTPARPLNVRPSAVPVHLAPGEERSVEVIVAAPPAAQAQTYGLFAQLSGAGGPSAAATATIAVQEPVEMGQPLPGFSPSRTPQVTLVCRNRSRRAVTGTATLGLQSPVSTAVSAPLELAPGQSAPLLFPLKSGVPLGRPCRVNAELTLADGSRSAVSAEVSFTPCLPAPAGVVIDGDLAEWPQTAFVEVGGDWTPLNPTLLAGDEDCSARFAAMWDAESLHLAVMVTDDVHLQTFSGTAVWRQDSVQVGIDPLPGAGADYNPLVGAFGKSIYEYGLALTNAGPQAWRWLSGDPEAYPQEVAATQVRLGVRRDGTVTTYEAAIPWPAVGVAAAAAGQTVGLALAVNDDDGRGRNAILWFDGITNDKDPSRYGRLTLVGD